MSETAPIAFREDLPVPEPWRRTLWQVLKPLPLTFGLIYGMQRLLGWADVLDWKWFLWMGGFISVQGVLQRRKGLYHPQSMIAVGALTLGASALVISAGVISGETDGLAMGVVFLVFSAIILVAGFRARTLERERVARLEAEASNAALIAGAIPVSTLRARVQRFKERMSRANKGLVAGFVGVLGVMFGGLTIGEKLGWPDSVYLGLFFFFWGGIGGVMWYGSHLTRKVAQEVELECPACKRPLLNILGSQRLMAQLEDLGRCPQCAARITVEVL